MRARDRALFGTSIFLYSGPLYAGLGGSGFETMPLFAAFFMVWLFIVRPGDWPRTREAWGSPRAIAWPMLIFTVQMLVVGFCLVMGRAIGGIYGLTLPLPLALTIGISFMGIFAAWILRRKDGTPIMRVPGESLGIGSGVMDVAAPKMPGENNDQTFIEDVSTYLTEFGEDAAPTSAIGPLIDMIEREHMGGKVIGAFRHTDTRTLPFIQAEAMLALRPDVAGPIVGDGQIGRAVARALATKRPMIVSDVADAARECVAAHPKLVKELAGAAEYRRMAEAMERDSKDAALSLRALADALDRPRQSSRQASRGAA